MEVKQETERTLREPEIRQKLYSMTAFETFDRLDFQDDNSFDDQIKPVSAVQRSSLRSLCLTPSHVLRARAR